ncbi:ATP-binding protein [Micrococcaceae bacterium Sec5.7]
MVADPDPLRLADTAAVLAHAGFSVVTTQDGAELAGLMKSHRPAVVVLDSSLSHSHTGTGTPVLLLVDLDKPFRLAEIAAWGISDYIAKPPAAKELVHRVKSLTGRAGGRRRTRSAAEALRESLRNVSAAIRATNDPQLIAEHLVNGFGASFGADRVWFSTFRDDRVPMIRAQWRRPGLSKLPSRLGLLEDRAHRVANRLWQQAEVLTIVDHQEHYAPFAQELQSWSGEPNPRASVVVPVGEGDSALGVIWIGHVDEPREWTRAEISLIQHVAGNVAHGLIQGHLISAQQQVLQQLRQLDKAKTDFLANVNHELRTPLTSITAYLDMIRDGTGGPVPEGIAGMVEIISRNSDRLRRLIEDLLTVSKQDGATTLNLTQVDIGQLLEIVVATLRPLADSRGVAISFADDAEDLKISADERQLEQVFTNIIANAIKFTPDGGRVTITGAAETDADGHPGLLVQVQDTGCGIPEAELQQVFNRFFRASNASSAAIPGSGLGLAIAHDIMSRHSGQLELTSTLGTGTTVSARLPRAGP